MPNLIVEVYMVKVWELNFRDECDTYKNIVINYSDMNFRVPCNRNQNSYTKLSTFTHILKKPIKNWNKMLCLNYQNKIVKTMVEKRSTHR